MKRVFTVFMVAVIVFSLSSCADTNAKGTVVGKSASGSVELDIMPQKIIEKANIGDTVVVTIGEFSEEMPFVDELIEEDGKLQLFYDKGNHCVYGCVYNQSFCDVYDVEIGERVRIRKK